MAFIWDATVFPESPVQSSKSMKTVFIKFCAGNIACTEFLRCSVEESLVKEIAFSPESSVAVTA